MATLATRGSGMNTLSLKDAERALARYAKQGWACVAHDESQQRAYLQLHATCGRVDGKTFLHFLNSKQSNVVCGATSEMKLWGVPKSNFAKGLPADIPAAIMLEEQLYEMEAMGGESTRIDLDTYHVIDKVIDRSRLGKGVVTLRFLVKAREL